MLSGPRQASDEWRIHPSMTHMDPFLSFLSLHPPISFPLPFPPKHMLSAYYETNPDEIPIIHRHIQRCTHFLSNDNILDRAPENFFLLILYRTPLQSNFAEHPQTTYWSFVDLVIFYRLCCTVVVYRRRWDGFTPPPVTDQLRLRLLVQSYNFKPLGPFYICPCKPVQSSK